MHKDFIVQTISVFQNLKFSEDQTWLFDVKYRPDGAEKEKSHFVAINIALLAEFVKLQKSKIFIENRDTLFLIAPSERHTRSEAKYSIQ